MKKMIMAVVAIVAVVLVSLVCFNGLKHANDKYAVVTSANEDVVVYNVFREQAIGSHWDKFVEPNKFNLSEGDTVIVSMSGEEHKNFLDWSITDVNDDPDDVRSFVNRNKLEENPYFF